MGFVYIAAFSHTQIYKNYAASSGELTPERLERKERPCSLLYEPDFFYEMADRFIKQFREIKFIPTVNRNVSKLSTPKQFKDYMLAELLSNQPADYLEDRLQNEKEAEIFKKSGDIGRFEKRSFRFDDFLFNRHY